MGLDNWARTGDSTFATGSWYRAESCRGRTSCGRLEAVQLPAKGGVSPNGPHLVCLQDMWSLGSCMGAVLHWPLESGEPYTRTHVMSWGPCMTRLLRFDPVNWPSGCFHQSGSLFHHTSIVLFSHPISHPSSCLAPTLDVSLRVS